MMQTPQKTLLVVEDSDEDYVAFVRAYKKTGFNHRILRCVQGDEVVPFIKHHRLAPMFDQPAPLGLIILDLNLPSIDGREVLKAIKHQQELQMIPIVVLSTSARQRDIHECYAQGASSYIVKSLDFDHFSYSIKQLCEYWFHTVLLP